MWRNNHKRQRSEAMMPKPKSPISLHHFLYPENIRMKEEPSMQTLDKFSHKQPPKVIGSRMEEIDQDRRFAYKSFDPQS